VTLTSHSEEETIQAGRSLGTQLQSGAIVLLHGNLGAGKTAFVRGLAEGLGIEGGDVSSPTFTLVQEYRGGRLTLFHIDLYRLVPKEVDELGLDDMAEQGGVMAIEWPDRWIDSPPEAIHVQLTARGDSEREIRIETERLTAEDAQGAESTKPPD
jgi:tRNA threonylcarbamoyladenosine biosynthesis protein TsaE